MKFEIIINGSNGLVKTSFQTFGDDPKTLLDAVGRALADGQRMDELLTFRDGDYRLTLTDAGQKIDAIRSIRAITSMDLKVAKDTIEGQVVRLSGPHAEAISHLPMIQVDHVL